MRSSLSSNPFLKRYCVLLPVLLALDLLWLGLVADDLYRQQIGALFGFVAYATFDLTSLALIRGWSTLITVVDLAWGATLTATAAWLTCRISGHAEVSR